MVKERTGNKFGEFSVNRHIEYLVEQKTLGYLKEVVTRDKTVVLQINSGKYKEVLTHIQEMNSKRSGI